MRARGERGFTLIELAVSLALFAVAIVSLSLLFDRAMSATSRGRFDQVAKTVAQETLEEIRSLPYHIPLREEPGDVDLLDRYFVDADGANDITPTGATGVYDGTSGTWSYTSSDQVAQGTSVTFTRSVVVRFVRATSAGALVGIAPATGYDSDDPDLDRPASDSALAAVTVSWLSPTGTRSVTLDTVITDLRSEEPKVEASGSVIGALVSGVTFQDGDTGGVTADVQATVGEAVVSFREVADSASQAAADPVDVLERDLATNADLQAEQPAGGDSSATAPNSTTGAAQATSASVTAGEMASVNAPTAPIATWGAASPSAATEARVSPLHSQNPEARAAVAAGGFLLNARDQGEDGSHPVLEIDSATGLVEQRSTTGQTSVVATVDLTSSDTGPAVAVLAAPQFEGHPDFQGVITIGSMHVEVEGVAGASSSSTRVVWQVQDLRVWDPDLDTGGGEPGGYVGPYTFGFDSACGGWVDDPTLCGVNRTDGKEPFENPNPILIPDAYVGTDGQGNPASSLSVVAGVTVRDAAANASAGASNASAAQKNILAISTRDDIAGAVALEPMLAGLGDATASVSYVSHEH